MDFGKKTRQVLRFGSAVSLDDFKHGRPFELTGDEAKHAKVLRLQQGELIDVVDGSGLRVVASVVENSGTSLVLQTQSASIDQLPGPGITLVQALAKSDRDEIAIATAVECGVDAIVPWQADRSIVQWRGDRAAKSHSKWVAAVHSATKQSRRSYEPIVQDLVNSKNLTALIDATVGDSGAVWILDGLGETAIAEAPLPTDSVAKLLIIVGPEGGISEAELKQFKGVGASLVRLGPHVMRTSTPGPIAVAFASQRLGRW